MKKRIITLALTAILLLSLTACVSGPIKKEEEKKLVPILISFSSHLYWGGSWSYTATGDGKVAEGGMDYYNRIIEHDDGTIEIADEIIPGGYKYYAFVGVAPGEVTLTFTGTDMDDEYDRVRKTVVYRLMVNDDLSVELLESTESGEEIGLVLLGDDVFSDCTWSYEASGDGMVTEASPYDYWEAEAEYINSVIDDDYIYVPEIPTGNAVYAFTGEEPGDVVLNFSYKTSDCEVERMATVYIKVYADNTVSVLSVTESDVE